MLIPEQTRCGMRVSSWGGQLAAAFEPTDASEGHPENAGHTEGTTVTLIQLPIARHARKGELDANINCTACMHAHGQHTGPLDRSEPLDTQATQSDLGNGWELNPRPTHQWERT